MTRYIEIPGLIRDDPVGNTFWIEGISRDDARIVAWEVNGAWYFSHLFVSPSFRGRGLAGQLLDCLCDAADRAGRVVETVIDPSGPRPRPTVTFLRSFYGRRGFVKADRAVSFEWAVAPERIIVRQPKDGAA